MCCSNYAIANSWIIRTRIALSSKIQFLQFKSVKLLLENINEIKVCIIIS